MCDRHLARLAVLTCGVHLLLVSAASAVVLDAEMATTMPYDLASQVGPSGTPLPADNWIGDDITNWIVSTSTGTGVYLRNTNDGDDTITSPLAPRAFAFRFWDATLAAFPKPGGLLWGKVVKS